MIDMNGIPSLERRKDPLHNENVVKRFTIRGTVVALYRECKTKNLYSLT